MSAASNSQGAASKPHTNNKQLEKMPVGWAPRALPHSVRATTTALLLGVALLSFGCDKLKGATSSGGSGSQLSPAGTDFEGEITATFTTTGTGSKKRFPTQMIFSIRKPKYRVDTIGATQTGSPQPAGSLIIDLPSKHGFLLSPEQKLAMAVNIEQLTASSKHTTPEVPGGPKATSAPAAKIDKTGKKDVVAGYACEIWNITHDGTKSETCVAEGATWTDLPNLGMPIPEAALTAIATEANRFPLRVVAYDAKGDEETRMEVVKVDKKKLEDALFAPPPDYQVIDTAQLLEPGRAPVAPTTP